MRADVKTNFAAFPPFFKFPSTAQTEERGSRMDIAKPLADEPRLAGFAGRDAALRRPRPRFPGFGGRSGKNHGCSMLNVEC